MGRRVAMVYAPHDARNGKQKRRGNDERDCNGAGAADKASTATHECAAVAWLQQRGERCRRAIATRVL